MSNNQKKEYRAVSNFIHHEMKLDEGAITSMIKDAIERRIDNYLIRCGKSVDQMFQGMLQFEAKKLLEGNGFYNRKEGTDQLRKIIAEKLVEQLTVHVAEK